MNETSIESKIDDNLYQSIKCKQGFWAQQKAEFFKFAETVYICLQRGNKVLIAGNGGSACDATHFCLELVNRFLIERPGKACISLNSSAELLTCIGNDYSFEEIFSRQIQALGNPGDVFIGISTSGNSKNIIKALVESKKHNITALALLGKNGGVIKKQKCYDMALIVDNSDSTPRIQECHEWILHNICEYLDLKNSKN